MPIDDLLSTSFQLLFLGMGTVFFILLLLIACISLMSVFTTEEESANATEAKTVTADTVSSTGVIAAIQAAVHFYRASPNR